MVELGYKFRRPPGGFTQRSPHHSSQADLIENVRVLDFLVAGQQKHFAYHFRLFRIVVGKGPKLSPTTNFNISNRLTRRN